MLAIKLFLLLLSLYVWPQFTPSNDLDVDSHGRDSVYNLQIQGEDVKPDNDLRIQTTDSSDLALGELPEKQREFLRVFMYTAAGLRVFYRWDSKQNKAVARKGYQWTGEELIFPQKFAPDEVFQLRVLWSNQGGFEQPAIVEDLERKVITLEIPESFNMRAMEHQQRSNLLLNFLAGHSLHPYQPHPAAMRERVQLGEPRFIYKHDQKEALRALRHVLYSEDLPYFAVIGPVGFGKTLPLRANLQMGLAHFEDSPRKLHIVTTDKDGLVAQLQEDVEALQKEEKLSFEIIRWGGDEGSEESIEELQRRVRAADSPTVLVTTLASLRSRVGYIKDGEEAAAAEDTSKQQALNRKKHQIAERVGHMRDIVGTITVDEGHHMGGPYGRQVLEAIVQPDEQFRRINSKQQNEGPKLCLLTATPYHEDYNLIKKSWGYYFLPYIHKFTDYVKQKASERVKKFSYTLIQEQQAIAAQRGENTAIRHMLFIHPEQFSGAELPFMVNFDGSDSHEVAGLRKMLNPAYIPSVINVVAEKIDFSIHKKIIIFTTVVDEAKEVASEWNALLPDVRAEAYYFRSDTEGKNHMKSVYNDFKNPAGNTRVLVAVNQLDEGRNIPEASVAVFLTLGDNPSRFTQRLGRLSRLFSGKRYALAIAIAAQEAKSLKEQLRLLDLRTAQRHNNVHIRSQSPRQRDRQAASAAYQGLLAKIEDEETSKAALSVRLQAPEMAALAIEGVAVAEELNSYVMKRNPGDSAPIKQALYHKVKRVITQASFLQELFLPSIEVLLNNIREEKAAVDYRFRLVSHAAQSGAKVANDFSKFAAKLKQEGYSARLPDPQLAKIDGETKLLAAIEVAASNPQFYNALDAELSTLIDEAFPNRKEESKTVLHTKFKKEQQNLAQAIKALEARRTELRHMANLANRVIAIYKKYLQGVSEARRSQKPFSLAGNTYNNLRTSLRRYWESSIFMNLFHNHPAITAEIQRLKIDYYHRYANRSMAHKKPKAPPTPSNILTPAKLCARLFL